MFSIQLSLLIVLSIHIIITTSLRCNEDITGSFQVIEDCRACVIFIAPTTLSATTTIKPTVLSKEMFTSYDEPSSEELILFGESKQSRRRRQLNVDTVIHQKCARESDGPLYGYDQTHCYCSSNQCNSNIQRCIYEVTSKRHFACYHGTNSSLHPLEIRPKCRSCRIRIDSNSLYHYECLTFGEREQKNRTYCTCQRPMCNQDVSTCQKLQPAASRPRTNLILDKFLNSTVSTTTTSTTTRTSTTTSTTIPISTTTIELTVPVTTEVLPTETIATTLTITTTTITTTPITTKILTTTPIITTILTTTTTVVTTTSTIPTTSTTISTSTTSRSTTISTTTTTKTSAKTKKSTSNPITTSTITVTTTTVNTTLLITTTPMKTTLPIKSETEEEHLSDNSTSSELTTTSEITTSFNELKHLKTDHIEVKNRATCLLSNFLLICVLFQPFFFLLFTRCDH